MADTTQIGTLPTSNISQSGLECLEQLYTFRKQPDVLQFIEKYPFLLPVLLEAPDKIHNYFPNAQLFLQVVSDPEIIDYIKLVLSICMNFDPYEAMDREDVLRKDWWLAVSHEVRRNLSILLEYP